MKYIEFKEAVRTANFNDKATVLGLLLDAYEMLEAARDTICNNTCKFMGTKMCEECKWRIGIGKIAEGKWSEMRLIDEDALIDALNNSGVQFDAEINRIILEQPTVTEWISVSERFPEEEKQYLCLRKTCEGLCYEICRYIEDLYKLDKYNFIHKKGTNGFYVYDSEYGYLSVNDVIAWLTIPKYKGEVDE